MSTYFTLKNFKHMKSFTQVANVTNEANENADQAYLNDFQTAVSEFFGVIQKQVSIQTSLSFLRKH